MPAWPVTEQNAGDYAVFCHSLYHNQLHNQRPVSCEKGILASRKPFDEQNTRKNYIVQRSILEKSVTEQNVGDYAVFCRQKANRTFEQDIKIKIPPWPCFTMVQPDKTGG